MAKKPTFEELEQGGKDLEKEAAERRRAEDALWESEKRYKTLVNNLHVGVYRNTVGPKGRFIEANPAIVRMFGYQNREEFLSISVSELYENPRDRKRYNEKIRSGGIVRNEELRLKKKDGKPLIASVSAVAVKDDNGNIKYYDGIIEDVTQQKKVEEALRESEERYRSVFENTSTAVGIIEEDMTISMANTQLEKLTGYRKEELEGKKKWAEFAHREDLERMKAYHFKRRENEEDIPSEYEFRLVDKKGRLKEIFLKIGMIPGTRKSVASLMDITSRKLAEKRLRESEEKYRRLYDESKRSEEVYRSLLHTSADAIVVYDMEGEAKYINPSFTRIFGWTMEEMEGKRIPFVPESEKEAPLAGIRKIMEEGEAIQGFETKRYTKSGRMIDVGISASRYNDHKGDPAGMLVTLRDISERKRLEARLQQAQKMEAIGTLAGGIAHDFNNMLYPIVGYAEMIMDDVPGDSVARGNLRELLKAAERARGLVQQILTFSRQGEQERKPIRIQPIIEEALKLLRASIPSNIEIIREIVEECGAIEADPTQIHQVMMNLCTNAYHAMRDKGGELKVALGEGNIHGSTGGFDLNLNPGPHLILTVSDTGHGMEHELMEKIFDPYFSTKGPGEGTGMGLSVVHGIVRSYGGDIRVQSLLGKGTSFIIYLPRVGRCPGVAEAISIEPAQGGREHILLVDDEEQIVRMVKQMLERLGYEVTARTSSVEALEAFRVQPERFDLVITDQTMPNMTGAELARKLLRIRPNLGIILCTGFSELITEEKAKAIGIHGYVMKPVVRSEIAGAIRAVLDPGREP